MQLYLKSISVDSITFLRPDDVEAIVHDTERSFGNSSILEDGRTKIEMSKAVLDEDFFIESNEHLDLETFNFDNIANWNFVELFVIGDSTEDDYEDLCNSDFEFTYIRFQFNYYNAEKLDTTFDYELTAAQLTYLNNNN